MFLCQRDSFLKECKTYIVSCNEVQPGNEAFDTFKIQVPNPPNKLFEVNLAESVLFPEGGGQPDDRGYIEDKEVMRVIRKGKDAIHYVTMDSPFKDKQEVFVRLAWERRFDHMQQHSGQHLITAVADRLFGFATTSWWLGEEDSYIELDTKDVSDAQIQEIENEVNLKIRENAQVNVEVVELDNPKLQTARGRNLPEDVKGDIRIVTMNGIESNVCCGTHVSSLCQLQVIKLLFSEKRKGKSLLHFLVGNRVLSKLGQTFQREQKLVQTLKSCPAELVTAAEKLNDALKTVRKCSQTLGRDLAALESKTFGNKEDNGDLWHYHRDNVDMDFGLAFLRELAPTKKSVVLITIKTEGSSGYFFLRCPTDAANNKMTKLADDICLILEGKGTFRGNIYQAKVSRINAINKALKVVNEFLRNNENQ